MKVSIITATWNSGGTVRDTIESVLRQTCPDIEYIIVDGASRDNTMDIVREYEPRFNGRMKWVSEPDRGLYDAMNKGLAMSTGDVIGILNSDDFYTRDDIVETLVKKFDNPMVEAIYGDIHYVDPKNLNQCVRYYSSRDFKRWKMRMGFMPAHPSFYCRRQIFEWLGGFDTTFKVAADFEQLLRFIYKGAIRTMYIPMDFVTMRTGGASTSGMESHKRILKDHLRAYRKNGVHSGYLLESLRYASKLIELAAFKLTNLFKRHTNSMITNKLGGG